MKCKALLRIALLLAATFALAAPAAAQTVRIGFITVSSGLNATLGEYMEKGWRLYMKQHEKELPAGVKIEVIARDTGGPNPDKARQLAQELIVREKVQLLTGVVFTPNAMAIAPLVTEAKVPFLIMNAGTSSITTRSPYIARVSFTLWQSSLPLGTWSSKKFKTAYVAVSDYGPGHDAQEAFTKGYGDGGGKVVGAVRIPLQNPDFAPYLQRVKDAKPDALFVFVPAGRQATAIMRAFGDLGLDKAGIRLIGPGDITTDEELPNMAEVPLGVLTVFHYSAAADRPANKAFVAAWKKEYGQNSTPNFVAVGGWDGMDALFQVIREQKGRIDPDHTMEILKQYKNPQSPRGPIAIDPETRDIVQNEYLREVRKIGGQLANVEIETVATALKDPWKVLNKKN